MSDPCTMAAGNALYNCAHPGQGSGTSGGPPPSSGGGGSGGGSSTCSIPCGLVCCSPNTICNNGSCIYNDNSNGSCDHPCGGDCCSLGQVCNHNENSNEYSCQSKGCSLGGPVGSFRSGTGGALISLALMLVSLGLRRRNALALLMLLLIPLLAGCGSPDYPPISPDATNITIPDSVLSSVMNSAQVMSDLQAKAMASDPVVAQAEGMLMQRMTDSDANVVLTALLAIVGTDSETDGLGFDMTTKKDALTKAVALIDSYKDIPFFSALAAPSIMANKKSFSFIDESSSALVIGPPSCQYACQPPGMSCVAQQTNCTLTAALPGAVIDAGLDLLASDAEGLVSLLKVCVEGWIKNTSPACDRSELAQAALKAIAKTAYKDNPLVLTVLATLEISKVLKEMWDYRSEGLEACHAYVLSDQCLSMCGSKAYDPKTQGCCGEQTPDVYDLTTQYCCDGVYVYNKKDCCLDSNTICP